MCETSSHVFVVINIIPEGGAHGSFLFLHHYMDATQESRRFSWQRHVFLSFFGERRACYCFRALEAPTFCKQNLCFAFLSFSPCLAGKHEW
jgi:hypothetical protein